MKNLLVVWTHAHLQKAFDKTSDKISPTLIYDRMRLKVLHGFIPDYR